MSNEEEESKELENKIKPILERLVYNIVKDKHENIEK